jgi:CHAD domain-containing protein
VLAENQSHAVKPELAIAPSGAVTSRELWLAVDNDAAGWDKGRKLAFVHLDRILDLVPKILRSENPDQIHDLRVASRRLQAVVDVLTVAPASSSVRRLRRKIKRSRVVFSDVRNCDVMIERIETRLKRRHAGRREAWMAVLEYVRERRSGACTPALRKLSKLNFGRVYVRLQSFLASPPEAAQANGHGHALSVATGDVLLKSRLTAELEKAWRRFRTELTQSQQSLSGQAIHQARIAAKRLRYLVEVMDEFQIPGSRDTAKWLRQVQQYLGDWHDRDVEEQMIAEMLARPQFILNQLELATQVVRLLAQERKAKLHLSAEYQAIALASPGGAKAQQWVEALLSASQSER